MNEELKKEEVLKNKTEEKKEEPKKRQIILETDGNSIKIIKAEVTGSIELIAILSNTIEAFRK